MASDITEYLNSPEKKLKLVLSVIGDSKSFVPRAWPKSVFKRSLIETGKSSGGDTLILYRNKDVGVSTVVQDAYNDYLTMQQSNKEQPIKLFDVTLSPKGKTDGKSTATVDYKPSENVKSVDNDETNNLHWEEFFLKKKAPVNVYNEEDLPFEMPIPVVIILLEGDLDSIKEVMEATRKGIPVIIVKGSGKAADIILDNLDSDPSEQNHNLKTQAALLFGLKFQDERFVDMEKYIKEISEKRWMVTQFDSEKDNPLIFPKLVGEAVVRSWALENIIDDKISDIGKMPSSQDLYSLPGIPKEIEYEDARFTNNKESACIIHRQNGHLLQDNQPIASWKALHSEDDNTEKISSLLQSVNSISVDPNFTSPSCLPLDFFYVYQVLQENELMEKCGHSLLLEAMKTNRCDYVKVLMDHGVNIRLNDLPVLYRSTLLCKEHDPEDPKKAVKKCKHLGMMWLMKRIDLSDTKKCFEEKSKGNDVSQAAKAICRKLLDYQGDKDRENVKNEDKGKDKDKKSKENKHGKHGQEDKDKDKDKKSKEKKNGKHGQENQDSQVASLDDLLLWALYANRPQIAEILWLRGNFQLMTGLLCYEILRDLSEMAGDVKEQNLSNELLQHGQLFYKKTLDLLDAMYEREPVKTKKLIDDPVTMWGICSSPLTFAYESFMYDFIAKPASQKFLNDIWYNHQAPDFVPWFKSLSKRPMKVLRSPLMKYIFNYILFLSMLVCYSGFVTTSVKTIYYERALARVLEYYVYFWGFGDLLEEIFSCFGFFHEGIEGKSKRSNWAIIKRYLNNFWNIVDIMSYSLLVSALCVRHFHPSEEFTIARRMFALSLLIMYLRFLEAFLMFRKLGPTLIMIKEMLKDLLGFISLMIVVILGVGFYYHANLWPDHVEFWKGNWANWRIWKVLYYPYWQMYGETFHEFLGGDFDERECSFNKTEWSIDPSVERCPEEDWTVLAMSAFYMLFSNLLLVNLVIAMFSSTYERVTANAENLWRFERYSVIINYKCRVPSPVNLLWFPVRIYKKCKNSKCRKNETEPKDQKKKLKKAEEINFRRNFQRIMAYEVSDKFLNNVS